MNNEFWNEVTDLIRPPKSPQLEYRLHYDLQGQIVMASMHNHPESGQYVVVTKTEYDRYFDYCIVNQQLKKIDHDAGYRVKLRSSNQGYCVVQNHASILIEKNEQYPNTEHYARTN
jgi:hypothetical protein